MIRRAGILAVIVVLVGCSPPTLQKSYSGTEAVALRCANAMAFTAVALEDAGLIPEAEKEVLLSITIFILERHVSGTWEQKKEALGVVRDRRDGADTLEDFERIATECLRQFPVN